MHSNPAKPSATASGAPQDGLHEAHDPVLARRLVLLRGLGKGAVAAAALAPLAGHATRSYVLPNPNLPAKAGGVTQNGYCSVSGFQSAAISVAPGQTLTTCSALAPEKFYVETNAAYSWESRKSDNQNRDNRRAAVRSFFVATFGFSTAEAGLIPDATIDGFTTLNVPVIITGGNRSAIYWATSIVDPAQNNSTGTGAITQLKASDDYPTTVSAAFPLRSFENMMDNVGTSNAASVAETVLYTLFKPDATNKAYFAAVALSCIREDSAFEASSGFTTGSIPFDAKYVGDLYNNAEKQAAAGAFFKALCGK